MKLKLLTTLDTQPRDCYASAVYLSEGGGWRTLNREMNENEEMKEKAEKLMTRLKEKTKGGELRAGSCIHTKNKDGKGLIVVIMEEKNWGEKEVKKSITNALTLMEKKEYQRLCLRVDEFFLSNVNSSLKNLITILPSLCVQNNSSIIVIVVSKKFTKLCDGVGETELKDIDLTNAHRLFDQCCKEEDSFIINESNLNESSVLVYSSMGVDSSEEKEEEEEKESEKEGEEEVEEEVTMEAIDEQDEDSAISTVQIDGEAIDLSEQLSATSVCAIAELALAGKLRISSQKIAQPPSSSIVIYSLPLLQRTLYPGLRDDSIRKNLRKDNYRRYEFTIKNLVIYHYIGDDAYAKRIADTSTHGNSKNNKPFLPTEPFTLRKMEEKLEKGESSANTYRSSVNSGLPSFQTARNMKQVHNLKDKMNQKNRMTRDSLFNIVMMAETVSDPNYLAYLAAFATNGKKGQSVTVKFLPCQSSPRDDNHLALLLILLGALKDDMDLKTAHFTDPPKVLSHVHSFVKTGKKDRAHSSRRSLSFDLYCCCNRPYDKKISTEGAAAFSVSTMTECDSCKEWVFAQCQNGPPPSTRKEKFWPVPEWGGRARVGRDIYEVKNTCPLDSFLAIVLSDFQSHPSLLSRIGSVSPFEKSLRGLLQCADVNEEKAKIIVQHYSETMFKFDKGRKSGMFIVKENQFDLFQNPATLLATKLYAKGSKVKITYDCDVCDRRDHSVIRFQFEPCEVPNSMAWPDIIKRSIEGFSLCKGSIDGEKCNNQRRNVRVEAMDSCWVIDIYVSVLYPLRSNASIPEIPTAIEVGDATFRMAGIILYSGSHYVSLIPHKGKWMYYYGTHRQALLRWITVAEIPHGFSPSNIIYFRDD